MKKLKRLLVIITLSLLFLTLAGCASIQRDCKDCQSDVSGGLDRIVIVYDMMGNEIKRYEGKIDLPVREDARIEFEYNGKRIIWYNAVIEIVEK